LGDTTNAWKFDKRIHETATDSRVRRPRIDGFLAGAG
jgi:hypothetical protein